MSISVKRRVELSSGLRRILGAALLGIATAFSHAVNAEEWLAYTYDSNPELPRVKNFKKMLDEITAATNGELTFKLHIAGSLPIKSDDITLAVGDDTVQIADNIRYVGFAPISGMLQLPFFISDYDQFEKVHKIIEPLIEAAFDKQGVTVLGRYVFPMITLWSREKLTRLSDLQDMKIRVTSAEGGQFISAFKGIPITIGTAEVSSALDRSVVNGVITSAAGGGYIWRDLLKYNYRINIGTQDSLIVVNSERLRALPPEVRAKVQEIIARDTPLAGEQMRNSESELTAKLAAGGIIVTPAAPEDVTEARKRMASFWDEWAVAKGAEAVEALAKAKGVIAP